MRALMFAIYANDNTRQSTRAHTNTHTHTHHTHTRTTHTHTHTRFWPCRLQKLCNVISRRGDASSQNNAVRPNPSALQNSCRSAPFLVRQGATVWSSLGEAARNEQIPPYTQRPLLMQRMWEPTQPTPWERKHKPEPIKKSQDAKIASRNR